MVVPRTRTVRIVVESLSNGDPQPAGYRLVGYSRGPALQRPEFASVIELMQAFSAAGLRMKNFDTQAVNDDGIVYAEDRSLNDEQLRILGLAPE